MAFAKALTIMSETSERKIDILEKINLSQVVGSSFKATVWEVVGQNNEDNNKLMACLASLKNLKELVLRLLQRQSRH